MTKNCLYYLVYETQRDVFSKDRKMLKAGSAIQLL